PNRRQDENGRLTFASPRVSLGEYPQPRGQSRKRKEPAMPKMIWLGMDVHAASITVAQYEDQAPTAMVQTIANDPAQVRRLVRRLPAGSGVRARAARRRHPPPPRHGLAKFLLRHGHRYPESHWTKRHWEWVCGHTFDGPARTVFVHYCDHVLALNERLAHLERELRTLAESAAYQPVVTRLSCLRGLATLSALVLIAELYDLRRFRTPRELMAYLGLVPSEHS